MHGDYLYAVGGTDGQVYSIDVHRLDLRTRQWQRLSDDLNEDSIPARYRHEIAIYDDKIYVFGGGTPSFVYGFSEVGTVAFFFLIIFHFSLFARYSCTRAHLGTFSHGKIIRLFGMPQFFSNYALIQALVSKPAKNNGTVLLPRRPTRS